MTQDTPSYPLRHAPVHHEPVFVEAHAAEDDQPSSPIKILRRALHGRYLLTAILCGLLGGAGGAAGWSVPTPVYKPWGMIDVQPTKERILYFTEGNSGSPMSKQVVGSIAQSLKANDVVDKALATPEWLALGRTVVDPDAERERFKDSLETVFSAKSTIVAVSYQDPDPKAAMIGVNAVMAEFMKIYQEKSFMGGNEKIKLLEQRRETLIRTNESLKSSVFAYTDEKGSDAVLDEYHHNISSRTRHEERIEELRLEIASLEAALANGASSVGGAIEAKTAQQIALIDFKLQNMLERREMIAGNLDSLTTVQGYGGKDPRVLTEKNSLASMDRRIEKYVTAFNGSQGGTTDQRIAVLAARKEELARVQSLSGTCDSKIEELGRTLRRINTLQDEIAMNQTRLNDVKTRINQLDMESQVEDRVKVLDEAKLPVSPFNDKRFAIATGGGLAGVLLAFGVMVLIGLSNQRVRNIVDMDEDPKGSRFLGILPDLPGAESDSDTRSIAEHCIHNVRTLLQLHTQHRGAVTVVTSATASAGKTTLSCALGLSFAATGGRTLLVDADLVGRGLTSSIKALLRQRVLRLLDEGDVDGGGGKHHSDDLLSVLADAQMRGERASTLEMDELFDRARRFRDLSGERSTEIQRMLQVLQGQEVARERRGGASTGEIRRTILAGSGVDARSAGILEALCGAPLRDCVVRTGVPNLHVLTAGGADARDAGTLAPEAVMGLLNACTQEYDHIVFDTGPILGSLEASILCAQADAVLLTVSRGDERSLTVRALERLRSVHAKVSGIVFNRADMSEVRRSNFSSQWRSDQVEVV